MHMKIIGAILVVGACGGFGFSLAHESKREERLLLQILQILDYMQNELQYHLTPLSELCRGAGKESGGELRRILVRMARELEAQLAPDAASCMEKALCAESTLPRQTRKIMKQLGKSLGRFDLPGQLNGLEGVRKMCKRELKALEWNRDDRLRSYRTLGLCAGAALAILLV